MSVNFGYGGYGIMNSLNPAVIQGNHHSGNTFLEMKQKYGCENCFQDGPTPYNYQMQVNPLPIEITHPSFLSRLIKKFTGA